MMPDHAIETIIKYVNLFVAERRLGKATAVIKTTLLIDTSASLVAFGLLWAAAPYAATYLNADLWLLQLYGLTILTSTRRDSRPWMGKALLAVKQFGTGFHRQFIRRTVGISADGKA